MTPKEPPDKILAKIRNLRCKHDQLNDIEKSLIIEDYKAARGILYSNVEIVERTENFCILGVAALISFSIVHNSDVHISDLWGKISCIAAVSLSLLGFFRFIMLDFTIKIYNEYIENIENIHNSIALTSFYRSARDAVKNKSAVSSLYSSRLMTWAVLISSSSVYAAYKWWKYDYCVSVLIIVIVAILSYALYCAHRRLRENLDEVCKSHDPN